MILIYPPAKKNNMLYYSKFRLGIGWNEVLPLTIDTEVFLLGENKKIISDDYFVFYNSEKKVSSNDLSTIVSSSLCSNKESFKIGLRPVDPELSIVGPIDTCVDNAPENEDIDIIDIDLDKVRLEVQEIIFTASVYEYNIDKKFTFGRIENLYFRLFKDCDSEVGKEDYRYYLTEDYSTCASIELCRIYRFKEKWKIEVLGIGHKGGLEELVEKFT